MKCPECQFENREGVKFCEKCGIKLELICPKCGAKIPPDRFFCGECGHKLDETKEAATVDYSEPKSYTPKHLKDKILTTRSSIEGERKLVTVFFADVANYTAMSEKLDPEEVHQIMDGCFKILMDEIHKYEGTINQFTGDGVMALFGAPVAHEDHAQRACYAALSIQKAMAEYGEKIKKETGLDFKMRTGLNSGHVIVGSIGDDLRMDYTAVGDTTNLAARMETSAKLGSILVSENTHKIIQPFFEFNPLGKLSVKGKQEEQEAYELIRPSEITTRIEASAAKGLTRFVGRKKSMASLIEAWNKAKSGSGQVVGVVGEAGVGKSRLLLEFRHRLSQEETIFLEGHCLHYGGDMPYLPILDIIKSLFKITDQDREYIVKKKIAEKISGLARELEPVIPCFQELLSVEVEDAEYLLLDPQTKKSRTLEGLRSLFIRLSQTSPLVIVIEDLHWIDKTTEVFINYLVDGLPNTRIFLILLYRPEYIHQWGSKSFYTKIGLDQLGPQSSMELIKALLNEGEVAPELQELILDRAAGNPLFMEEFTQTLRENGSIEKQGQSFILTDKDIANIPETIQGIISARMDRLEENLKRTMQVASVIGRDFAFRILQTISGMKSELKTYLLNLQGLEFIYEKQLFPELEYIFKHALIQEVAYNSLLQSKRKEIHGRTGEAIEHLYAEKLDEYCAVLAHHYANAGNYGKAAKYSKLAFERAFYGSGTKQDSIAHAEKRVAYLEKISNSDEIIEEIIEARNILGNSYCLFNNYLKAKEIVDPIVGVIEGRGKKKELAWVYITIGQYNRVIKSDYPSAIKFLTEALEMAEDSGDILLLTSIRMWLGITLSENCQFEKAEYNYGKAIELVETIAPQHIPGLRQLAVGTVLRYSGKTREGYQKTLEYLNGVIERGDIYSVANSSFWLGSFCVDMNYLEKAERYLLQSLEYCKLTNFAGFDSLALNRLGYLSILQEDYGKAKQYYNDQIKLAENKKYGINTAKIGLAHAKVMNGEKDINLVSLFEIAREKTARIYQSQRNSAICCILLNIDNHHMKEAEKWIKKTMEFDRENGMMHCLGKDYALYSEWFKRTGNIKEATKQIKKAIEILKECGADGWVEKYGNELAEFSLDK